MIGQYLSPSGEVISHLNISSVHTRDGGLYSCLATNTVASVGHSARINIYGDYIYDHSSIPQPAIMLLKGKPITRGEVNVTGITRHDALLLCPVSGYPVEKVEWSRDNRIIRGPRPAPLSNGTLLIKVEKVQINSISHKYFQEVGKSDSGKYSCVVSNSKGDTATGHILLAAIEPPKISPFTFDGDLKEGDRSQVSCTISSGDMPCDIQWRKDGRVFSPSADIQVRQFRTNRSRDLCFLF